jgi:hypothetical protein
VLKEGPPIRYRIDRHDRSQLELKLDYPLREGARLQNYLVQTFVFVPRVLDLTKRSYSKESFYADSANFLRMTTPRRRLSDLSEKSAVKPWAHELQRELADLREGDTAGFEQAERSLKLLGCVFKGALRDGRKTLFLDLEPHFQQGDLASIDACVSTFIEDLLGALRRLRKVAQKGGGEDLPGELADAWHAVDEYSALIVEEAITEILLQLERRTPADSLPELVERLKKTATDLYRHRRDCGYETYVAVDGENEYLAHRWRVLKRFLSSALYVKVDREETGLMALDIIGGVAAALAMLVATVSILFINERWPANLSWAFVTAMVVSYVVKDRLKEWGKRSLGRRLTRGLSDHVLKLRSPSTGRILGKCKENFTIKKVKDVPLEVADLRFADLESHDAIEGRPETVMWYTKEISLSSEEMRSEFPGASGITDVFRLNVNPMLSRMDDTHEQYNYVHPESGELRSARCARVYHVNIVLCLSTEAGEMNLTRVRAVLNKKGLLRVESVDATADTEHEYVEEIASVRMVDDDV